VLDNQPKGRDRLYCNNKGKCKQAHHRQKQREAHRADILQMHNDLCDYWQGQHIGDELLILLQNILIREGEKAARAATNAILAYAQQERAREPQPAPQMQEHPARRRRKT
jgi:hypothetical protein